MSVEDYVQFNLILGTHLQIFHVADKVVKKTTVVKLVDEDLIVPCLSYRVNKGLETVFDD